MTTILLDDLTPELIAELKVEMWGEKDDERIIHETAGDAIGYVLDDITEGEEPDTLMICGFARQVLPDTVPDPDVILEDILEFLDDNYGDPEEGSDPTDDMNSAAQKLSDIVRAQYFVWQCDAVLEVEVDVKAWMLEEGYSLEGGKDGAGASSSFLHSDTELKP